MNISQQVECSYRPHIYVSLAKWCSSWYPFAAVLVSVTEGWRTSSEHHRKEWQHIDEDSCAGQDSHYRNQFETNTSGGLLKTSAREKWERGPDTWDLMILIWFDALQGWLKCDTDHSWWPLQGNALTYGQDTVILVADVPCSRQIPIKLPSWISFLTEADFQKQRPATRSVWNGLWWRKPLWTAKVWSAEHLERSQGSHGCKAIWLFSCMDPGGMT